MPATKSVAHLRVIILVAGFAAIVATMPGYPGIAQATPAPPAARPRVWVSTDLTNPDQRWPTDKDDIVTMTGLLLLANKFDIQGLAVGAHPRGDACGDAANWANTHLKVAYSEEVGNLNKTLGGYPESVNFWQASACGRKFDPAAPIDLPKIPSVKALIDAAQAGPLFVLNWSPMTETATAVKYLVDTHNQAVLDNISVVSHWTAPSDAYNCDTDAAACAYLHGLALAGKLKFYELGAMGQEGLVDNRCYNLDTLSQVTMSRSKVGAYMNEKWNGSAMPDMSDGSTYLMLAGFGGGLGGIKPDGSLDRATLNVLCNDRGAIFSALETAAEVAAGGPAPTQ